MGQTGELGNIQPKAVTIVLGSRQCNRCSTEQCRRCASAAEHQYMGKQLLIPLGTWTGFSSFPSYDGRRTTLRNMGLYNDIPWLIPRVPLVFACRVCSYFPGCVNIRALGAGPPYAALVVARRDIDMRDSKVRRRGHGPKRLGGTCHPVFNQAS